MSLRYIVEALEPGTTITTSISHMWRNTQTLHFADEGSGTRVDVRAFEVVPIRVAALGVMVAIRAGWKERAATAQNTLVRLKTLLEQQ